MRRLRLVTICAATLLALGVLVALACGSSHNWHGIAIGAVITLAGVGVAVLSLQER